ncbi:TetR/AcrR family transcriptional regulator [Mycolicibacterium gilvum]|uniref:Transcriptional regulator, TetR family n=1 Tax=Mycolicibacterium gilvum (strain DSM 45189 / LMG 24558 / Spyr1) TaxID=278137 RepID=E6TA28_MYCSR|nr:TetR/AcrR family transcriptional regulator [Mycolicibacterium gilvum]ADT97300.1 transcriptional regulator, TetR family [Mycolicibacterium gilvum Spyr1]
MAHSAEDNGIRRRPKDRKAQIARASAEAFSELGYHGVSMEMIASRVGISAAALYRHYAGKYELFRDAVLNLGQQLVDGTAGIDGDDPEVVLDRLVSALIDIALVNRSSGGLYRWERRYLRGDDQAELLQQLRTVHHRLQTPVSVLRPELTARQRSTLSTAVLSIVGSIVDHRAKLPAAQIHRVLTQVARAILATELPDAAPPATPAPAAERIRSAAESSKYEALLAESMRLFNLNGYRDTSMEEIASAVGMPASGIYKYFSGKNDILAAIFRRASDRVSAETAEIVSTVPDPQEALAAVIDAYVTRAFGQPEMESLYYSERLNMSPSDQRIVRDLQRSTVESWVELVAAVRPDWTPGEARFAVHAAMALVIDVGRLVHYAASDEARDTVEGLVDAALRGSYRLRATLPSM